VVIMELRMAGVFQAAAKANHGGVTDPELRSRARNAGIATEYYDWQGHEVEVPAETLAAILEVLAQPPALVGSDVLQPELGGPELGGPELGGPELGGPELGGPELGGPELGGPELREPRPAESEPGQPLPLDPVRLALPAGRDWGFTVQLYSIRSRDSWGHGDLHDLADLARWSASALGAGFVLINPLHAAEPQPPISPSPYLPMTRLFTSPLYLRVEDIPEYDPLPAVDKEAIEQLAGPLRAANSTADLIDRDAVWQAKRTALRLIKSVPLSDSREHAYKNFRAERGRDLELWSIWCALAERHGPDWRDWPAELADRTVAAQTVASDDRLSEAAEFHAWLQWHADEQLAAAQNTAKKAGMAHGIIHDLAVGVHPGGADAWSHRELLASGFSVGAPPDGFNQLGQDWAEPPWSPRALAATGYRPLAELFDAAQRHGGGLRVDHVMGLMRLWWIPAGQQPDRGAYVSYDHRASVAALTGAAARAGAVAIGEDLGTVDPWIREYLADQGILGTMMLWFARDRGGRPLPPARWRRRCMATVGTHDVPPVTSFVTGEQVTVRAGLGLLKTSEDRERGESEALVARWRAALEAEGLLATDHQPDPAEFTVALYGYLRKTPALLLGVSLADAVGEIRTQNFPGTCDEYPNWRIPLCDDHGRAVLLEELPDVELLRAVCQAVRGG
jgi:4-alpha-glucanotransferase